jgi:hypothetical protein
MTMTKQNIATISRKFTRTYPLAAVGRDDIHVHADKGGNAVRDIAGVIEEL